MLEVLVVLVVIGAVLYLVNLAPLDDFVKKIIYVVGVVFMLIYLIRHLGVLGV